VGISSANPHETSLVHLGEPSGLKGLLHTLNATVIPTTMTPLRHVLLGTLAYYFSLFESEMTSISLRRALLGATL